MLLMGRAWRFQDMSWQLHGATAVGTHESWTHLNITGKGVLLSINNAGTAGWTIQVDGGTIWSVSLNGSVPLLIPFSSSVVVKATVNPTRTSFVMAALGDYSARWSDWTLACSAPTSASHQANTALDVSGSGALMGISITSGYPVIGVELDSSGTVYEMAIDSQGRSPVTGFFVPFKTRIKVSSSGDAQYVKVPYKLD